MATVDEELDRCRDRLHQLEGTVSAHTLLLRDQGKRLGKIDRDVDALIEQKKIEQAVSAALKKQGSVVFSRWQKAGAALVGGVAIVDGVIQLVQSVP